MSAQAPEIPPELAERVLEKLGLSAPPGADLAGRTAILVDEMGVSEETAAAISLIAGK
ncbi:MAG: hypothetical protein HOC91_10275 [Nitrospinaceae bacterium]|jgi:hypothetical protein|nr:hypothetical protein [Nitrospinaceae bacterium]MBT3434753.1 hypothetical protein [Nitrospinaceae bacterium]MBT3822468.1 hypothetical protein [Nitrospinaceae bacterium]MBT4095842.1 hypothetical protein [Nitrospinaceae bacterium]MBT4430889.1 hypothetical protein [Nitrospinaceae bacterium]